jgi:uncharacterized membrane protein
MGKLEYLDALKRAMLGLQPDVQAKTLAYYEQRFVDGVAAGRSEADVTRELDEPKKIAMTLRASAHLNAFKETKNPASLARMAISGFGLAIFNLFMLIPALVYAALLFALYTSALVFYLAGIATTASGLAGTNELVLDWPNQLIHVDDSDRGERQMLVTIGDHGIHVSRERVRKDADINIDIDIDADGARSRSRVLRGAEAVADSTLRIRTDMDADSRTAQTLLGAGMVLGGIALLLASLVVTRYTWVGLKRYLQMNRSMLKGS